MNIKRISAAAIAAAVLAVGAPVMGLSDPMSVVANAAETPMLKVTEADLLKLWDGEDKNPEIKFCSKGWFILYGHENAGGGMRFLRIDDEKWRSTGKVEYTKFDKIEYVQDWEKRVVGSVKLKDCLYVSGDPLSCDLTVKYKENPESGKFDKEWDRIALAEIDIFGDGITLTPHYPRGGGATAYPFYRADGYSIGYRRTGGDHPLNYTGVWTLVTPDGSIDIDVPDKASYRIIPDGEFVAIFFKEKDGVYGVKKNGSVEKLDNVNIKNDFASEAPIWWENNELKLFGNDGNVHTIKNTGIKSGDYVSAGTAGSNIILYKGFYSDGNYHASSCVIDGGNGNILSADYSEITLCENGVLFVVNPDGSKSGFMDFSGKELKMFDIANAFSGTFAPVVDGGRGWLIDKDMNRVSDTIDASNVATMGENFYRFTTSGGEVFVTMSAQSGGSVGGDTNTSAITDKNTGVSVTGVSGAAEVKVSTKKNDNGSYTYDITPVDASGNKVQPAEAAVVGIMLPAELKGKTLNVYRVENGKYTKMNSWADGDMLFFTTSHFSEFEITTEQRADANPETGSAGMFGLAAVCIAAVGVMLVSRKKK